MKRFFAVLCVFILCCNAVLGNDQLSNQGVSDQIVNETTGEIIDKQIKNNDPIIQNEAQSLKETILNFFKDEQERTFYSRFIQDENNISQGMAARLICQYIGRGPIYLPEKELCSNPYIGRLVIERVWSEFSYDEKRLITLEDWNTLIGKAEAFKTNKNYVREALENDKSNIKQKVSQYRETVNQLKVFKKVSLGTMTKSNLHISLNEQTYYGLYEFLNTSYISLTTLENMGFQKQANSGGLQLIWQGEPLIDAKQANLDKKDIYLNNESVYIGELKTYSLNVGTDILIPMRALQVYFDIQVLEDEVIFSPKYDIMSQYVLCDQKAILNRTDEDLEVIYSDFYWDGKNIIENKSERSQIMPRGMLPKNTELYALRNAAYLTTVINYIQTGSGVLEINHNFGQDSLALLNKYNEAIIVKPSEPIDQHVEGEFPASIIIGTMKYSTNGLAKGEKVEVSAAEDGVAYFVKNSSLKTVKIPWNSISIPKNPPTAKDKPTKEQIETFINSKNMSSQTVYLVWTDLYRQQTYILKGKKNEWKLIRTLLSSSGKNTTPTPRGIYELKSRVPYFGVDKGYRCKNAFQIYGDYLYHSIIFDVTGTRLLEGKGVLGKRASHGCIRFSEEDSLWFYNTMKTKTRVWIN